MLVHHNTKFGNKMGQTKSIMVVQVIQITLTGFNMIETNSIKILHFVHLPRSLACAVGKSHLEALDLLQSPALSEGTCLLQTCFDQQREKINKEIK